jgi:hypothetical protein
MVNHSSFSIVKGIVWTLTAILSMTPTMMSAQHTDIRIDDDSSLVIEKVYAGLLSGPSYDLRSGSVSSLIDLRVGAAARFDVTKKLAVRSFGFAGYDVTSGTGFGNTAFWAEYTPSTYWKIIVGHGPSLTATNHRPHPCTLDGQFEFFATAQLPGVMTNATIIYKPRYTTYAASVGIYQQQLALMCGIAGKRWSGTGYYLRDKNQIGGALTYNGKKLQTTLSYTHNDILSLAVLHDCGKHYVIYGSEGYEHTTHSMVTISNGVGRTWSGKYNGLFALGYEVADHQIKSYLMVTL